MEFNREGIFEKAARFYEEEKFRDLIELLRPQEALLGADDDLCWMLADSYRLTNKHKEAYVLYKKIADATNDHFAEAITGFYLVVGDGVKPNAVEALAYLKKGSESDNPDAQYLVLYGMGMLYDRGAGVSRDIPKAYDYYRRAREINETEPLVASIESLEQRYPLSSHTGEIKLGTRKRSGFATLFLWLGILGNLVLGLNMYFNIEMLAPAVVSGCCILIYLLVLMWTRISFYLMATLVVAGLPSVALLNQAIAAGDEGGAYWGFVFANSILSFLILFALLKRKKGYAHPWYSLLRIRDNGCGPVKRLTNIILAYGEGDSFKNGAPMMQVFNTLRYVALLALLFLAAYAAYGAATTEMNIEVEWNCFENSTMYSILCVIGFFAQFAKGMWVKSSYETYNVYEDEYGNVKKVEKDHDMMNTIEGSFLFPLLSHLLIIPMAIGAVFYYIIMAAFALIQGVVPYLLAAVILGSLVLFYKATSGLILRKFRMALLAVVTALFAFVYMLVASATLGDSFAPDVEAVAKYDRFVECTTHGVNLRKEPSTSSSKPYIIIDSCDESLYWEQNPSSAVYQLRKGDILPVIDEVGDWYKVKVRNIEAHVMKRFCKQVSYSDVTEVLSAQSAGNWYKQRLVKRDAGKYKNLYVYFTDNDMDGVTTFYLGQEVKGCIVFTHTATHAWGDWIKSTSYGMDYATDALVDVDGWKILDLKNVSDSYLDRAFEDKVECNSCLYYFNNAGFTWIE